MSVLVTGAGGYLGRHVVARLAQIKISTIALCRKKENALPPDANIEHVDLSDAAALHKVFDAYRPQTIVHCAAAIPSSLDAQEQQRSEKDNVEITKNLLNVARQYEVERIVFASTVSVYTGPRSNEFDTITEATEVSPEGFYGRHKLAAEDLCRDWCRESANRACVILRYAGLHGAGRRSGVVYAFVSRALKNAPLLVASPQSTYCLLNVQDAAQATVLATSQPANGGVSIFNIAGAESVTLGELARKIIALSNSKSDIVEDSVQPRASIMSIRAAQLELGFQPTPLMSWLQQEIALFSKQS